MKTYTVAIYLCDRAYGGPEEGGWWYDTGLRLDDVEEAKALGINPNDLRTVFEGAGPEAEKEAFDYCHTLNQSLDAHVNGDRPEISSVLSEGRYHAEVHDSEPPKYYPATTPHYE